MNVPEAVTAILSDSAGPLTPQQIRDRIKERFPFLYNTDAQRRSVEKGHCRHIDHALLAQVYTLVGTGSQFARDKSVKPMRVSLIGSDLEEDFANDGESYDSEVGHVYVLATGVYTEKGRSIVKVGQTAQSIDARITQLYTTGSPFKFEVLKTYKVKNYVELEQAIHRLLAPYRLNKGREFFSDEVLEHIPAIVDIHERIQAAAN